MYDCGQGLAPDATKAVALYRKAAAQGNAKAEGNLGFCLLSGRCGVAIDPAAAIPLLERAVAQGNARAMHHLAQYFAAPWASDGYC